MSHTPYAVMRAKMMANDSTGTWRVLQKNYKMDSAAQRLSQKS